MNRPILRASFLSTNFKRVEVLHLCGKSYGMSGEIERGDLCHPALPAKIPSHTSGAVLPTPQINPRPSYDDATFKHGYFAFWFFSM